MASLIKNYVQRLKNWNLEVLGEFVQKRIQLQQEQQQQPQLRISI